MCAHLRRDQRLAPYVFLNHFLSSFFETTSLTNLDRLASELHLGPKQL